jgi:Subtilase family
VVGSITNIPSGYQGSNSVRISYFSSVGPTSDGRIKPDVVAPGENIFMPSTNSLTAYTNESGTSFSAPAIASALNLIVQEKNRLIGTNSQLLASTLRGLAIHTADAAGTNAGPNYKYGWGLFDAKNAVQLFVANTFTNSLPFIKEIQMFDGDYIQFPITVTNGTPQLKVTICWTDPAGSVFPALVNPTNLALINDLDLRVISPNGATNYPWVLNPANPVAAATKADNSSLNFHGKEFD